MNTFQEFLSTQSQLNTLSDVATLNLKNHRDIQENLIGWDLMIITTDYRFLKSQFDNSFKTLQNFNKVGVKKFKKELNKHYSDKRKGLIK